MSTRAVFTFKDKLETHHVYKHHDGYPRGAYRAIEKALEFSWPLPRFEVDEFAAAFVSANKDAPGGVRFSLDWKHHADLEYRYEVYFDVVDNELKINAYSRVFGGDDHTKYKQIFSGTLEEFRTFKE
jgi:hypothetical protein